MNGATAEPCVNTTSRPSSASISTIGPSHHFLRTRMKAHSSAKIPNFSRDPSNAIRVFVSGSQFTATRLLQRSPSSSRSVQLVERAPVHVLAQRRLLPLVEHVMAEHEPVPV